jgi:hypothetical protein
MPVLRWRRWRPIQPSRDISLILIRTTWHHPMRSEGTSCVPVRTLTRVVSRPIPFFDRILQVKSITPSLRTAKIKASTMWLSAGSNKSLLSHTIWCVLLRLILIPTTHHSNEDHLTPRQISECRYSVVPGMFVSSLLCGHGVHSASGGALEQWGLDVCWAQDFDCRK